MKESGQVHVGRHPLSTKKRTELSSVANAVRLIRIFSDQNHTMGISAMAANLKLAKSTVHRLATTLVRQGILEQNVDDGKYRLGLVLFELGSLVRRNMSVTEEAKPFLKQLSETTGETLYLAVLDHHAILYITVFESQSAIRMGNKTGTRSPLHCAAGKMLLAFQAETAIEDAVRELPGLTAATITDLQAFRSELAAIRARGYAVEDEEIEMGLRGIAAAIRGGSGEVIAAIGLAGPAQRLTKKMLHLHAHDLMAAAAAVSQRLGYKAIPAIRVHRAVQMPHVQLHSHG